MTQISPFVQARHRLLNLVHTWLLVGGSLLLFAITAFLFFGSTGIWYALAFGAISLYMAGRVSPALVLRMYKAMPVSRAQFPTGHALLDELTRRAGLPSKPVLHVLPSQMMNAFAVGRRDDSAICFTDALIGTLTPRELAGVMAHEVSHIANGDIRVMAIADMVSRFTSILSTVGMLTLILNFPAILVGNVTGVPWLAIGVLMASPTIGSLLQLALSRTREYDADLGAAMLTGDPDGLASALLKLERQQKRNWEGMVLPGGRMPDPSILRSHPRTSDRIARLMALKEMAPDGLAGTGMPLPEDAARTGPLGGAPKRPPSVPTVRPNWGRNEAARYMQAAPLLGGVPRMADGERDDCPSCFPSPNPADGRPRIRVFHGGVYW